MAILTVGAVLGSITGALSNVASGAIAVIKVVASVATAALFAVAIASLLGNLQAAVYGSIVGEVFALLSVFLPFNPATVFSGIYLIIIAIISFLVAQKMYQLTSYLISVSGH